MAARYFIVAICSIKSKITNSNGVKFVILSLWFRASNGSKKDMLMHKFLQIADLVENGLLQGVDD